MTAPMITERMPPYPTRRPEVIAAAVDALQRGEWARLEGVPETEAALREYHGGSHVWFISSGTAALEAILLGHGIGPGDEVITTPYTWGATVSAILAIGAIPVFADIDPISGLLDPDTVESCITPRTRAILAVHLFGHPCDAVRLRGIADRHGLFLFEDGSQAHGARLHGRVVGRFGQASAFSCMGLKLLAGTEGGYCLFEDGEAEANAWLYGRHPRGMDPARRERLAQGGLLDALQLGWRPCAVSAALVRAALPWLDSENATRRRNAACLRTRLEGVRGITLPPEIPGAQGCYHLLSLVVHSEEIGVSRDEFLRRMNAQGAGAFVYIPVPIHQLPRLNPHNYKGPRVLWHDALLRAGVDYRETKCPGAEWRSAHTVELGFNWTLDNPHAMEQLAAAVRAAASPS